MSGEKHTSGPWTACKDGDCSCGQVFGEGEKHVATAHAATVDSDGTTYATWPAEERSANARLIAAAPDLLAELERGRQKLATYVSVYPGDKELRGLLADWDAAIAKAKGETK